MTKENFVSIQEGNKQYRIHTYNIVMNTQSQRLSAQVCRHLVSCTASVVIHCLLNIVHMLTQQIMGYSNDLSEVGKTESYKLS